MKEHKYDLNQGFLGKSKLGKHSYGEDHKTCWKEEKVKKIAPNGTNRKCKEAAHMVLADDPISEPSLDISPIWTPIIAAEVSKLQLPCRLQ
jgi:hypothetical protein